MKNPDSTPRKKKKKTRTMTMKPTTMIMTRRRRMEGRQLTRKGRGDDYDDDDDSSDRGNELEGESDLSDDPLAEVDLGNILPSRTRRRVVQPGVYIAKLVGNNADGDDSDDSDA
ncbi:hypothetical protein CRYUN_Cryun17cG0003000 [Craigia yunnanensis]